MYNGNGSQTDSKPASGGILQKLEHEMKIHELMEDVPMLQELYGASADQDTRKRDFIITVGNGEAKNNKRPDEEVGVMQFAPDGSLLVGQALQYAQPYQMTPHGWTQFCWKLGEAQNGKKSALHRQTWEALTAHEVPMVREHAAATLNALIEVADPSAWMIRTYEDIARAFVSPSYAAEVSNTGMLRTLAESLMMQRDEWGVKPTDLTFSRATKVTPDDLFLQLTMKGVNPKDELQPDQSKWEGGNGSSAAAPYKFGIQLTHNETGRGGIGAAALLQRTSCMNSITAPVESSVNLRHRGSSAGLMYQITVAIAGALKVSMDMLDRLMKVRVLEIPNVFAEIDNLAEKYGWSTEVTNQARLGTEGQSSLYGLVNGVSSVPAHIDMDSEAVQQFEALAGTLLITPESVFSPREYAWVRDANQFIAN